MGARGMNATLEATGLAVGHGRQPVLRGVNLRLAPGTLVALIGVNGGGKTTLIRTLAGLLPPLAGSVLVDGTDLRRLSLHQRARRLAVVFTTRPNVGMLDVRTLVALGRHPWTGLLGRLAPVDHAKVDEALRATGTTALQHRGLHALSDGELQRVLIARALAQDTPVLLLDEPTAHLDVVQRLRTVRLLRSIAREAGRAVLYSTHDLENAMAHADTIALTDGGTLWSGPPGEAIASQRLVSALGWDGALARR
jgi:iron complex transport system ATP-binding protein